ncbi:MAG: hypothetical protein F4155_03005 [Acidimicrobiales bacterium]|nr:hypothetical protein [Acidimicrobiales bacterium]MYH73747.1 hypothetical protein [Acidimicrobiales bacterium]MYK72918.1 hypothetical protein [Acidimicrobiales bacterium]
MRRQLPRPRRYRRRLLPIHQRCRRRPRPRRRRLRHRGQRHRSRRPPCSPPQWSATLGDLGFLAPVRRFRPLRPG